MMTVKPTTLLTLPDEVLLQIVSTHLHIPIAEPCIVLPKPVTDDPVALKLTCRRLNQLVHVVEKGKVLPVTMFISRPIDIPDLLFQIKKDRVKRLVFTDTGVSTHAIHSLMNEEEMKRFWKQSLLNLITNLIIAVKSDADCVGEQIKAIEFWPDTQVDITTQCDETYTHQEKDNTYDRESETSKSTSFAEALFGPLATLAKLLNPELTLHTLKSSTDLIILTPLPPKMRFIIPLSGIPIISSRLYSDNKDLTTSYREDWTLVLPSDMAMKEIEQRMDHLLHSLNRRRMRLAKGEKHTARIILKYEPNEMSMGKRRELVALIRQVVGVILGSSTVSTDLEGKVQIGISDT